MYKIVKTEFSQRRPAWMVTLLLHLNPVLYHRRFTERKAQVVLRYIKILIHKTHIIKKNSRIILHYTPTELTISNHFYKPYLTFKIQKVK